MAVLMIEYSNLHTLARGGKSLNSSQILSADKTIHFCTLMQIKLEIIGCLLIAKLRHTYVHTYMCILTHTHTHVHATHALSHTFARQCNNVVPLIRHIINNQLKMIQALHIMNEILPHYLCGCIRELLEDINRCYLVVCIPYCLLLLHGSSFKCQVILRAPS